jgi:acetyl esterase/lipase
MKRGRFSLAVAMTAAFLTQVQPFFASDLPPSTARIDLDGNALHSAPNATSPREGKTPVILEVGLPNLQIHRTSFVPSKGTILLFPGGGYHVIAIEHEGLAIAKMLNREGYDVVILEYSIGKEDTRSLALAEATRALKLIQQKGPDLGINTTSLDLMGFSAGGHLACRLIHELGLPSPFRKLILIYPAYLNSPDGILSEVAPPKGLKTDVFVLIGDKDTPERVKGSEAYAEVSKANAQNAEYHLVPDAGHGFGIQSGQKGAVLGWPALLRMFLKGN